MIIYACQIKAERGNNISSHFPLDWGIDCLGCHNTSTCLLYLHSLHTHSEIETALVKTEHVLTGHFLPPPKKQELCPFLSADWLEWKA